MIKLAFRNIFRHKGRTALTLAAIVSGVAALVLSGGFVEDIFVQLREATIHSQLGHLQIYRTGYYQYGSKSPYKYVIDRPAELLKLVGANPKVHEAMARLGFSGILNNGRSDVAILGEGVEPDREARLGTLITITAGRQLKNGDTHGILLGEGVARATGLKPGDRATLLLNTAEGALNSVDFDVTGVFRSFSKDYDARAVRVPLLAAQELLATNSVNAIVLSLKATEYTDVVEQNLRSTLDSRQYEIKTWHDLADFYDKTVALYQRQFAILQIIILIAVLLSVLNSVNMSIFERTGEFGTLMALGNRSGTIFRLVLVENMLLGLLGSGMGVVLGVVLAWTISAVGIPMPPPPNSNSGYNAVIRVVPSMILGAFLIGFFATLLAALIPARRVTRIPVVEALRQN